MALGLAGETVRIQLGATGDTGGPGEASCTSSALGQPRPSAVWS